MKCLRDGSGRIVTNDEDIGTEYIDIGRIVINDEDIKETWKGYIEKVMNQEFMWDKNLKSLMKEGPASRISEEEVGSALKSMKMGRAPGLSGVVSEIMIAGKDVSVTWLTEL